MLISILFMIVVISLNDLRITNSAIVTSKYNNLVVCGPSGVGKGTLIQSILHKYRDQMALSVSQTTRAPRQGEVPGFHYDFVSRNYISSLGEEALQQYFLEHTIIHGNFYGTSVDSIKSIHSQGKICILDIDSRGVKQLKMNPNLNCRYLFIAPPSMEALEKRLRGRKSENEEQIQIRLQNAHSELKYGVKENFDKILVNEHLEVAREELFSTLLVWFPQLVAH